MDGPRVYAVASGKGGVGKTTSAVNLGAAFAEAGRTVAVVDVDLGMANVGDVLAFEAETPTLHDVLSGDADVEAAIRGAPGEFDAVVGSAGIEAFGRADPAGLRDVVDTLRERYDVVVLDTGGGLSYDAALPLGLADSVILVATPNDAALNNAAMTHRIVDRIGGDVAGVIVNRSGAGSGESQEAIETRLDLPVLGMVPEDRSVAESAAEGVPVVVFDRDSPAAQSFREIAYGILEEPLPVDWGDQDDAGIGSGTGIGGAGGSELAGHAAGVRESGGGDPATHEDDTTDEPSQEDPKQADSGIIVADAEADQAADADDEEAAGETAETAAGTDEFAAEPDDADADADVSGGPGIADAIETAESDSDAAETGGLVAGPGAEGDDATDSENDAGDATESEADSTNGTTATDEDASRSFLSKLTGGLFG